MKNNTDSKQAVGEILDVPDVILARFLTQGFREFPDRAAYHFMELTHTFKELDEMSARFARFLTDIGCKPGDVVGYHLPNTPQALIAMFGALRSRCLITGISPLLTPKEVAHQVNDSKVRVLVTMDALYENVYYKAKDDIPGVAFIGHGITHITAGIVHGQFLAACMDGVSFRTLPYPFRRFFHPVGQDVAESFPCGDHFREEVAKHDIKINTLVPNAWSRMTADVFPPEYEKKLKPQFNEPMVLYLCSDENEVSGQTFAMGAGWYGRNSQHM